MSPITLLIAVIVLLFILYKFVTSKPSRNFPPGPIRLPLVGSYFRILLENYRFPHLAIQSLARQYQTDILSIYFGDVPCVVANTYETCKEILVRPEFQGRPETLVTTTRARGPDGKKLGIFFDQGADWLHQRRFSLRKLRDLGFGRRSDNMEQVLEDEVRDCIEELRNFAERGEAVLIPDAIYPVMVNCIYHLIIGNRVSKTDRTKLIEFGKMLMRFQNNTDAMGRIVAILPFIRNIIPKTSGFKDVEDSSITQWEFIKEFVKNHKESFDKEALRDFIDVYLSKMTKEKAFTEEHLIMCGVDLILPATAAATAVSFALMFAIQHPHVLSKCQQEMDCVVGRGRLPNLTDRQYLPYTEATLREVLRKEAIAPLGVSHLSTEATTYFGYDIPANTVMITNLHAMHNDPKLWVDPENFRPERFLDAKGQLKKKDYSLPFGIGKRVCAGETFARQNIFVTMAAIFQNFNVEEVTPVQFDKINSGLIINPANNFYVKLVPR